MPEGSLMRLPGSERGSLPYVTETGDEGLAAVLRDEWPHDVLDGLP